MDPIGGIGVTVSPDVVRPRQTVTATISSADPDGAIGPASLEWGYTNLYRSLGAGNGEFDSDDWVCVTRGQLPGQLANTAGEAIGPPMSFKIPSWAPGSSDGAVRWSCRLRSERNGHDVDVHGGFTVEIGSADVEAVEEPMERVLGGGESDIVIVLPSPLYRSGDTISGDVVLTPLADLPAGDVAVHWQLDRESHPLGSQAVDGQVLDGPIVAIGHRIKLTAGNAVTVPFTLPLPQDAAPTTAAVHSSLSWYVAARVVYGGSDDPDDPGVERVRRPIVVINAP